MNSVVLPPCDAAVEDQQFALAAGSGFDSAKSDLDVGRCRCRSRALPQTFLAVVGGRRFELALLAGRHALGVDAAVLVGFDDECRQRRRMAAVGGGDLCPRR